jgi:hypothetical protein
LRTASREAGAMVVWSTCQGLEPQPNRRVQLDKPEMTPKTISGLWRQRQINEAD